MKFILSLIIFLSCQIALATDVKLGPNHKMGVVIYTSQNYSLVLTTKHGSTAKPFIKYDSKFLDASILIAKPLKASPISYYGLSLNQPYYHWNKHGYVINEIDIYLSEVLTTHDAWPGHSGSGLYDKYGNLVGMCVKYQPWRATDKTGRCISLQTIYLHKFIEDTIKEVEKKYGK